MNSLVKSFSLPFLFFIILNCVVSDDDNYLTSDLYNFATNHRHIFTDEPLDKLIHQHMKEYKKPSSLNELIVNFFKNHLKPGDSNGFTPYTFYMSPSKDNKPTNHQKDPKKWSNLDGTSYIEEPDVKFEEEKILKHKQRYKRSAPTEKINIKTDLKDNHTLLVLHWAGQGSDVIISLARDLFQLRKYSSNLYISKDFGITFTKTTLRLADSSVAQITWFYLSPITNTHYIFLDTIKKSMWTSTNGANSFKQYSLSFHPSSILFHPYEWKTIAALEALDNGLINVYISTDFAETWVSTLSDVQSFEWGNEKYGDKPGEVYIHTSKPSNVVKYNYLNKNKTQLFTNPLSFNIINEFSIVIDKDKKFKSNETEWSLWVSTNRNYFKLAHLPNSDSFDDIYLADASEHQIMVCATNKKTKRTSLYVSDTTGVMFTKSLDNIIYFNPETSDNFWLSYLTRKKFADLYKLEGLNGIYIANVNKNTTKSSALSNNEKYASMISFNKGAEWRFVPEPSMKNQSFFDLLLCYVFSTCNLNLAHMYHSKLSYASVQPLLSSSSAPGLVIGTGKPGAEKGKNVSMYISSDGGINWRKSLDGGYTIVIGDHGALMVAAKVKDVTKNILYSTDEGHSWKSYEFHTENIKLYGIFTEPKEETGVFTLFGSLEKVNSWIIFQLNLTKVFDKQCTNEDYTTWVPSDHPKVGCLLGKRMVYEKKKPFAFCFNGRNYDRDIKEETCSCKMDNYVCDYGYERNLTSGLCVQKYQLLGGKHACLYGDYYNRTRGYRKVPYDSCEGGMQGVLGPVLSNCPVQARDEFILFANMTSIHKYSYMSNKTTKIQLKNLMNVAAVEYDYENDCVFFADNMFDNIQRMCLRGDDLEQRVVLTENLDQIESLCYDWTSKQLYWLDVAHKRIECVKINATYNNIKKLNKNQEEKYSKEILNYDAEEGTGGKRIVIKDSLKNPRSLAIAPKKGIMFWSCWDTPQEGTIHQSNMIGANSQVLFKTSSTLNLTTPSGLVVDGETRLYFIDAKSGVIAVCETDKKSCKLLIDNAKFNKYLGQQQFYGLSVFKNSIIWTEAIEGNIKQGDRKQERRPITLLNGFKNILAITAMHATSQSDVSSCSNNPCKDDNALCFETSRTTFYCLCAQGFVDEQDKNTKKKKKSKLPSVMDPFKMGNRTVKCVCEGGASFDANGFCVIDAKHDCGDEFTCDNRRCVPKNYICDHDNDCGDMSDEKNCTFGCSSDKFQCKNGFCIDRDWVCDLENDCLDGSDEKKEACDFVKKTTKCSDNEFMCSYGKCIKKTYRCDGDEDCHDGSDEKDCNFYTTKEPFSCSKGYFSCPQEQRCIPSSWKCNGNEDCSDGSDEKGCSSVSCLAGHLQCRDKQQCVVSWKWCDGEDDCDDGSDEVQCTYTTSPKIPSLWTTAPGCSNGMFKCDGNKTCISWGRVCDGIDDCEDLSDEKSCANCNPPERFRCSNGGCVASALKCNGRNDCSDGSDEENCSQNTTVVDSCKKNYIRCEGDPILQCIPESWMCDGEKDCRNGWDETKCYDIPIECSAGLFSCLFSKSCIDPSLVCNHKYNCPDGSDELNCHNQPVIPPSCNSNEYQCMIGGCINKLAVCDEKWDCIGGSDEHNCSYTKLDIEPTYKINFSSVSASITIEKIGGAVDLTKVPYITVLYSLGTSNGFVLSNSFNITSSSLPLVRKEVNLRSNTLYYLRLTFSLQGQLSKQFSRSFTTLGISTIPNPPHNLTHKLVHTSQEFSIELTWFPGIPSPNKLYKLQYKVVLSDTTSHISTNSYKYTPIVLYTFDTSIRLNDRELIVGHSYEVMVYAFSTSTSDSSNKITFTYESTCIKIKETQLKLSSEAKKEAIETSYIGDLYHASTSYAYETALQWLLPQKTSVYSYKLRISRLNTKSSSNSGIDDIDVELDDQGEFSNFFGDINETTTWSLMVGSARDEVCKKTGNCSVKVLGMNPGSTYMVDLWANGADGNIASSCQFQSLFMQTPENKNQNQKKINFALKASKNQAEISISNLNDYKLESFSIEVRYGQMGVKNINRKMYSIKNKTKDLSLKLEKLSSCEKYCIDVSIVWPYKTEASNVICVDTPNAKDKLEAPKRLKMWKMGVARERTKVDVILEWQTPCNAVPANYTINVDQLSESKIGEVVSAKSFDMTDNVGLKVLHHKIDGLSRGHKYRARVRKNNPVGELSEPVLFLADPYPSPNNLTYELLISNAILLILRWTEPQNELPPNYIYEIHHSNMYRVIENAAKFTLTSTSLSTSYVSINQLDPNVDNSFKVRLVNKNLDIRSSFSNVVSVIFRPDQKERATVLFQSQNTNSGLSKQNKILAITIPILLAVVVVSSLVFYKFKNKSNDLGSITPRYRPGSDRAILALLGEEEDQPLLNSANEDDVLIIA